MDYNRNFASCVQRRLIRSGPPNVVQCFYCVTDISFKLPEPCTIVCRLHSAHVEHMGIALDHTIDQTVYYFCVHFSFYYLHSVKCEVKTKEVHPQQGGNNLHTVFWRINVPA